MKIIDSLRQYSSANIFTKDMKWRIRLHRKNHILSSTFKEITAIDPLDDFVAFKDCIRNLKASLPQFEDFLELSLLGADSLFYGHLPVLAQYAGLDYTDRMRLLLPFVEHGVYWRNEVCFSDSLPYIHNIISQGAYRHESIRRARRIPHYIIGPYIHYADPFYSLERHSHIKEALGRTLLVFPAHTYEASNVSYARKQYVDSVMNYFRDGFDTILVSCYWNDVEDETFSLFAKAGATVISCGIRNDPRFISRLKSAILLSDCVTGNSLGTHIGYIHHLERPFLMFEGNTHVQLDAPSAFRDTENTNQASMSIFHDQAMEAFSSLAPSPKLREKQDRFCHTYWGNSDMIRSPETIRTIFQISEDMLSLSKGWISRFDATYEQLLKEYSNDATVDGKRKALILEEALK